MTNSLSAQLCMVVNYFLKTPPPQGDPAIGGFRSSMVAIGTRQLDSENETIETLCLNKVVKSIICSVKRAA